MNTEIDKTDSKQTSVSKSSIDVGYDKWLNYSELSFDMKYLLNIYYFYIISNKKFSFIIDSYFSGCKKQDFANDYKVGLLNPVSYNKKNLLQYYKSDNILMLKPFTGQKKIIFFCGCGHQQQNCGGYMMDDKEIVEYRKEHSHSEYFSVDVDLGMAPHALGIIGKCTFSFIPSDTIEEILFEGGRATSTSKLTNEISRLLCESGKIIDGTTYSKEDSIIATKIDGKLIFSKKYKNLKSYFKK